MGLLGAARASLDWEEPPTGTDRQALLSHAGRALYDRGTRNLMNDTGLNASAARSERGRIPMRSRWGTRYNRANDVRFTVIVVEDNRVNEGRRERNFRREVTGRHGFSQALNGGRFTSLSLSTTGYGPTWSNRRNGRPVALGVTLARATRFAAARSHSLNL